MVMILIKNDVSENGMCLRPRVKPGPMIETSSIDWSQRRFYLRTETDSSLRNVVLIKITTMDNVQEVC
jgi:hypothetical protein